jgi:hypothetical protein
LTVVADPISSTLAPGQYELRLFAQDGFTVMTTSNTFIVDDALP